MSNWTNLNSIIQFDNYEFKRILEKLEKTEPDDEPLHILSILEECDYWYAVNCLNTIKNYNGIADFAIKCAESSIEFYKLMLKDCSYLSNFIEKAKNREINFYCLKDLKSHANNLFLKYGWGCYEKATESVMHACMSSFYAQRKDVTLTWKWAYRAAGDAIKAASHKDRPFRPVLEENEYEKQKQFFKEIFKERL
jgi:hypothetical protein